MKRTVLWISAIVVVMAIVAAVSWFSRKPALQSSAAVAAPASAAAPAMPPNSTPKPGEVLLVEYSDFQCPSCAVMFPLIRSIHQEFDGRIDFVFREFPLRQIHANAERAARAAEAAGQQNRFWEMADLLFKNQPVWSAMVDPMPAFEQYARSLNLDLGRFRSDYRGFVVRSKVDNDIRMGLQDGVRETPTIFLNGRHIRPASYAALRQDVMQALVASGK